jgi:hypothetical protein
MKSKKTSHNRIVYAAPLWGLDSEKPQSGYALCDVFLRHIFTVAGMLRIPLSQPQKRRIQPERYVTFALRFTEKYTKINLTE